jgi:SAM-dependent methyltransferase
MGYRDDDKQVWEGIFRQAPEEWLSASPSVLMGECAAFLREHGATRVLDLGSGFGRWTVFLAAEARCSVVGLDYALGGGVLGSRLAPGSSRARFVTGEVNGLPFADESFDGFVAVLILDNLARSEGVAAARELSRVTRSGAPGFVVLNPWPMPTAEEATGNPTRSCTRHDYDDEEAEEVLLSGWRVRYRGRAEQGLRAYMVRSAGSRAGRGSQ